MEQLLHSASLTEKGLARIQSSVFMSSLSKSADPNKFFATSAGVAWVFCGDAFGAAMGVAVPSAARPQLPWANASDTVGWTNHGVS